MHLGKRNLGKELFMRGSEHRKRSQEKFGREYAHVHKFIDEPYKRLGIKHREERHGFLDVLKTWWKLDFTSARVHLQHIRDDKKDTNRKLKNQKK